MFQKLMQAVSAIFQSATLGDTGYLDQMPLVAEPVKGEDKYGRPFVVLPLSVTTIDQFGTDIRTGVVTLFKRYADPTHKVWVAAGSHVVGSHPDPTYGGAIRDPNNGSIDELLTRVVKGETVTYQFGDAEYGFVTKTVRLLNAEERKELLEKRPAAAA